MPPEFAVSEEELSADRHVMAVRGEIDLFTAPELKQTLSDAIERGRTRIVVDLEETTFLDSTALGVLIGAVKRLRTHDGALAIVNTDANIAKPSRSPDSIKSSPSSPRVTRPSRRSTATPRCCSPAGRASAGRGAEAPSRRHMVLFLSRNRTISSDRGLWRPSISHDRRSPRR